MCSLMEKINNTSGTDRKKRILKSFVDKWREAHNKLHSTQAATTTDSFHPAMRLLLPQLDRARPAYGLKEVALAKQYIDILNIAKESLDAQKLLHYRAPQAAKQDAGDFAAVAFFVLRNRCPDQGSLTVSQVNQYLNDLAMSNAKKERAGVKKALQLLLRNTSAMEQKWLIRMILKELKTGLSENSVFSVFHPDAVDLFSVCSSLEKICQDLRDPSVHLNETSIAYFTPFRPMLGQRAVIDQVLRLMEHQTFFIETKFDGDRIQMHKQGNQYRYYTRSSRDYTRSFGSSPYEGRFTPTIHDAFNSKVKSCILDGEMVGWDVETESFLPKGDNVDVKALGGDDTDSGSQQCFVVFDVLMINDTNLANCPLSERAEQLKKVFEPALGHLHLVDRNEGSTKEDVVAALNNAIDNREEGIIVKLPSSTYKPDKRKGSGWLKIKPEYVDSLSDQLDVIIIGGYFGKGSRGKMISHFLCGVALPSVVPGGRPSVFQSFCKVGSGYSLTELREVGAKLKPHWRPFNTKSPPESVVLAPGFKERPDLWIEPQNSIIVQIKAAEIVSSGKYKCGCTLRFPRVEKVRDDKEWYDCMNVDELEQLKQIASGRLSYQHVGDGDQPPAAKKRRVGSARVERPRGVAAQFRQTDTTDVQEVSSMFDGKEFCVVNGPKALPKEEIEKKIAEHGGSFVQNPGPDTFCVLVNRTIVKATNIIKTGLYDVVKTQWFQDCLAAGKCLSFVPIHMLHISAATLSKMSELYDKYGDSYTLDLTEESIRDVFKNVEKKEGDRSSGITPEEIATIEERYFPNDSPHGLFRQHTFYLDKYSCVGNTSTSISASGLDLVGMDVRLHGGTIVDTLSERVSHIIFSRRDVSRLSTLRGLERKRHRKHHFVFTDWVTDCIESGSLKNERLYEP
ncbi:DNA ligase 4-like isoform X2 [Halichondria panicea]